MTNEQTGTLVLKDAAGTYFLVPQETLEQGRVPEEQKAELEHLLAEAAEEGAGGDVQGFILPVLYGAGFVVGLAAGYFGGKAARGGESSGMTTGQMIQGWVDQANGARGRVPQ